MHYYWKHIIMLYVTLHFLYTQRDWDCIECIPERDTTRYDGRLQNIITYPYYFFFSLFLRGAAAHANCGHMPVVFFSISPLSWNVRSRREKKILIYLYSPMNFCVWGEMQKLLLTFPLCWPIFYRFVCTRCFEILLWRN